MARFPTSRALNLQNTSFTILNNFPENLMFITFYYSYFTRWPVNETAAFVFVFLSLISYEGLN